MHPKRQKQWEPKFWTKQSTEKLLNRRWIEEEVNRTDFGSVRVKIWRNRVGLGR